MGLWDGRRECGLAQFDNDLRSRDLQLPRPTFCPLPIVLLFKQTLSESAIILRLIVSSYLWGKLQLFFFFFRGGVHPLFRSHNHFRLAFEHFVKYSNKSWYGLEPAPFQSNWSQNHLYFFLMFFCSCVILKLLFCKNILSNVCKHNTILHLFNILTVYIRA